LMKVKRLAGGKVIIMQPSPVTLSKAEGLRDSSVALLPQNDMKVGSYLGLRI
jgi:hypothetical protein